VRLITTGEEIEHFKPDCQASAKVLKYDTVEGFIYCPYCKRKVELSEKLKLELI
jgi:hypothetical protein